MAKPKAILHGALQCAQCGHALFLDNGWGTESKPATVECLNSDCVCYAELYSDPRPRLELTKCARPIS